MGSRLIIDAVNDDESILSGLLVDWKLYDCCKGWFLFVRPIECHVALYIVNGLLDRLAIGCDAG